MNSNSSEQSSGLNCTEAKTVIEHIQNTYHQPLKNLIDETLPLFEKVARVHGSNHPELVKSFALYQAMTSHLFNHLNKEDEVLFPMMIDFLNETSDFPIEIFGQPVQVMEKEHEGDLQMLDTLELLNHNFNAPADACRSYSALYVKLKLFSVTFRELIRLEEEVLFPKFRTGSGCGSSCGCGQ